MRFTQEEARLILKDAVKADFSGRKGEIDLSELLAAAEEAGLRRQAVISAIPASTLSAGGNQQKPGLFGGPVNQSFSLRMVGELSELGWQTAASRLTQESGDQGKSSQNGQSRIWTASFGGTYTLQIHAIPSGAGEIQIEGSLQISRITVLIHLLGLSGALIAGPILGATLKMGYQEVAVAILASAVALFFASRQAVTFFCEKEAANLKRLMLSASEQISKAPLAQSLESGGPVFSEDQKPGDCGRADVASN